MAEPDRQAAPDFHHIPSEHALARMASSREGLSEREAISRLEKWGRNTLPEPKGLTLGEVFLLQFKSPFIYLLLAAGAVSLALRHVSDAAFIFFVLILNACIGTYQEWRAEARARALRALIHGSATVQRDGRLLRIATEALVPGDMLHVESGERIAADVRLTEAKNLTVNESLLTGESIGVRKRPDASVPPDAPLGDRVTMLYAGSTVQIGRGSGVVVATGRSTVVGRLAGAMERPEPPPPLVRRMTRFTRHVAVVIVGVIVAIAALEFMRGASAGDVFLIAVALAVSAIPEGLPVAMTVALSIAMHRMGLRHVVVRHLPAVEGLGACTLIATDKTGTLTLNLLTVERVWLPNGNETTPDDPTARDLLVAGATASEPPAGTEETGLSGDAVDLAFFSAARAHSWHPSAVPGVMVERLPYEPEKRFAASFHSRDDSLIAYVKGAPETVAAFCSNANDESLAAAHRMSADGYRVIAVAAGRVTSTAEDGLSDLRLLGFTGLIDPLRPDAKEAVRAAMAAGIRVVMITGDHPLTALAIARQLGLAETVEDVVTGREMQELTGDSFDRIVARGRVFARTEPLQKLSIVESLRRQGHVIAVTGDGVNDAPALHAADIGVSMGRSGTDVARDASDLILTDDNFASIVSGIEEGRIAYDNLRKVILLLITTGAAEILLMLLSTLSGYPPPLTPVQLLWLNLITNGLQDVALAFEKGEPGILDRPPRPANAPIFDRRMIEQVALGGTTMGISAFLFYIAALSGGVGHAAAQGAVLWLMVWFENVHCFNSRSETRSVLDIPPSSNPLLVAAVIGTQIIQIAALSIPPLRDLLQLQALSVGEGVALAAVGIAVLPVLEGYKYVLRRRSGR